MAANMNVFHKIEYGSNDLSTRCLAKKQFSAETVEGIGPHSCWAMLQLNVRGNTRYVFGCSQEAVPVQEGIYKNPEVKCHGEGAAVAQALERAQIDMKNNQGNFADLVTAVYIELSPCADRCREMVMNVLPGVEIYYSFDHPEECRDWEKAASALCSK